MRGNLGAGLVEIAPVPYRDPATVVLVDPEVPEAKRYCGRCQEPVGRSHEGRAGRADGYCAHCGNHFSFLPKLRTAEVVAGQYEVVGCIAHGGLGWIYLAKDRHVSDRWVVLKGLLDSGDVDAMEAAIAERRFLAQVEHPTIVKIYNFVEHGGSGYVVMEYVGGQSLKEVRAAHRAQTGQALPVSQAIALVLEILPALGFLHGQGLLYCDFKPDNVVQTEEQLKLIDLGGVRGLDDVHSPLYGTIGYQAPEVPDVGASIGSDLYTVARTLAVLSFDIKGFNDEGRHAASLPTAEEVPVLGRYPSFHRFLLRATEADVDLRFGSAQEMADQLLGVLREVVAIDGGHPAPASSKVFTPEAGAGSDGPDPRWLPVPTADPTDAGAALLLGLAASRPEQVIDSLGSAPTTPETRLRLARAYLDTGQGDRAAGVLAELAADDPLDWRVVWWQAIRALGDGAPELAASHFDEVYAELPGELAPKLGAAVAAELSGRPEVAAGYYGLVAATDPSYVSAHFGLARCRAGAGDRAGAAKALRVVAPSSGAYPAAQIALCHVLSTEMAGSPPEVADLVAANATVEALGADSQLRVRLVQGLLESALRAIEGGVTIPDTEAAIGGVRFEERDIRLGLERTCRELARFARTRDEKVALIDRANELRPVTLL